MSDTFHDTWAPEVNKIAKYVARDYPDVEEEDIAQDLFKLILERQWVKSDKSTTIILRRFANWKASEYRAQHLAVSPQYAYRTSEVRAILERVFDYNNWPRRDVHTFSDRFGGDKMPQWDIYHLIDDHEMAVGQYNRLPKVAPATEPILTGGVSGPAIDWEDRLAAFCDVKAAWQRLPQKYRKVIFEKYGLGLEPDSESAGRQLRRAIERLMDALNT